MFGIWYFDALFFQSEFLAGEYTPHRGSIDGGIYTPRQEQVLRAREAQMLRGREGQLLRGKEGTMLR